MKRPRLLRGSLRAAVPTSRAASNDVHAAVAVDISDAHAVRVHADSLRDLVHDPRRGRIRRIRLGILHRAVAAEQHLGLSVAVDIFQQFDLGRGLGHDVEAIPAARFASRIHVQIDRPLIHHQDVRPAVAR